MRLTRQHIETLAAERGLKLTPQRRAIVEFLAGAWHHPSAEDVFVAVNARFPLTSRATVYNTLKLLKDASLVQELTRDGVVRFDPNLDRHHHFICRGCGRVEDLPWESVQPLDTSTMEGDRTIQSFDITFYGVCRECKE